MNHQNKKQLNIKIIDIPSTSVNTHERNEFLMKIAYKRVNFKSHVVVYLLVNSFISAICLVEGGKVSFSLWLWWGLGLAIQGLVVYFPFDTYKAAESEYNKLLKEQRNS